jgi:hypothetical protein
VDTIILINESKRAWSLPARPEPSEKQKLDPRGKPKPAGLGELEKVKTYRPKVLEPGERIEVPTWYFEELRKIKTLRAVFNRKVDGIAVGRTRTEEARAAAHAREAELEARAAGAEAAEKRVAELERELAKTKAELAKTGPKTDSKTDSKTDPKTDPKS